MNYFIDLFSPETARAFEKSKRDVSGFRSSRKTYIENQNIGPGDKFICYVTRIQRFVGVLEVKSTYIVDPSPLFTNENDPFILRFKVKPLVWLPFAKSIPIHEDVIWNKLSFTKELEKNSKNWTYMVFSSPRRWPSEDCEYLEEKLMKQTTQLIEYPFTEEDQNKLKVHAIKVSSTREVTVSVPDNEEELQEPISKQAQELRESLKVQAKLAEIGEKLGMKIWLPSNDRAGIAKIWQPKEKETLLDGLPLVFDEVTLKTIKNIDVLWIRRHSIVRAFEVEDTTSIYSGILRMADLLSLQPMLDIKIHIVAPQNRREEVFKQITRPVFSVMEKGPLSEICSYIPYDAVFELAKEPRLEHMTDTIIDEYTEYPEE